VQLIIEIPAGAECAGGMGISGSHVTTSADTGTAMQAAFVSGKAHLIEIEIEAKR
jgi:benzoylformate decarboxylase